MTKTVKITANSVTFSGLIQAIRLGVSINKPTIFLGTYGIAKSAGVHFAAAELGYCVVDFRAGEILPEDVGGIGIPRLQHYDDGIAEQLVERAVPDIITSVREAVRETGKPCILFLDEITSAVPAVQAALFQVLLDRRAGGRDFPPGTEVVAAGNLVTDRSLVEELARPLLNRAMVYNYTGPTFEEFNAYMEKRDFHPIIRTFLKVHEEYVCDKIDPESEQSPTPRSLETASDLLKSGKANGNFRLTALAATLGGACAHELTAFVDMHDQLTPIEVILADPADCKMPDGADFASTYMQITALASAVNARAAATPASADVTKLATATWTYIKRFPVEMGCVYLASANTVVLSSLLVTHITELQTMHGGAYLELFPQVAGGS